MGKIGLQPSGCFPENRKIWIDISTQNCGCVFLVFHPEPCESGSVRGKGQDPNGGIQLCQKHDFTTPIAWKSSKTILTGLARVGKTCYQKKMKR